MFELSRRLLVSHASVIFPSQNTSSIHQIFWCVFRRKALTNLNGFDSYFFPRFGWKTLHFFSKFILVQKKGFILISILHVI